MAVVPGVLKFYPEKKIEHLVLKEYLFLSHESNIPNKGYYLFVFVSFKKQVVQVMNKNICFSHETNILVSKGKMVSLT